jgi:hypothetical protein
MIPTKLLKSEINRSKDLMGIKENHASELEVGKKIEREHDPTYENIKKYYNTYHDFPSKDLVFMWIAEDHLAEFQDYYTRLVDMEKKAESGVPVNAEPETKETGIAKPRPLDRSDLHEGLNLPSIKSETITLQIPRYVYKWCNKKHIVDVIGFYKQYVNETLQFEIGMDRDVFEIWAEENQDGFN